MKGIDVCLKYMLLQEVTNKKEIMNLLESQAINNDIVIDPSEVPWCAAWVNFCERESGFKGTGKLNARSFCNYGEEVDRHDVQYGDIAVFDRGSNGYEGHVTYIEKVLIGELQVVGGNQHDAVTRAIYPQNRLITIRRSV